MMNHNHHPWTRRYLDQEITNNADQVEIKALVENKTSIKYGSSDEMIAGALDDFAADENLNLERWAKEDLKLDNAEGRTIEEIERRIKILGDFYPFTLSGASLTYTPKAEHSRLYEALLCICQAKSLTKKPYTFMPRQFEFISCIVCEQYLGPDSLSFRTGWPRGQGEPKRLKELVHKVRKLSGDHIGEWFWRPLEHLPNDPSHLFAKEYGVDVVAWKSNIDKRGGQMYLLGQCACGKDWYNDQKLAELDVKNLVGTWVQKFPVPHMNVFFTPYHAVDTFVQEASIKSKGVFFDRVRMVLHGENNPKIHSEHIKYVINKIINKVKEDYEVV